MPRGGGDLVAWDFVCSSKAKRGLGVCKMMDMNIALLCKWLWWLGSYEGLWKRVLIEKYGIRDVWRPNMVRGPYGRSLWKGIICHLNVFMFGIGYEAGKGDKMGFWGIDGVGINLCKRIT